MIAASGIPPHFKVRISIVAGPGFKSRLSPNYLLVIHRLTAFWLSPFCIFEILDVVQRENGELGDLLVATQNEASSLDPAAAHVQFLSEYCYIQGQ